MKATEMTAAEAQRNGIAYTAGGHDGRRLMKQPQTLLDRMTGTIRYEWESWDSTRKQELCRKLDSVSKLERSGYGIVRAHKESEAAHAAGLAFCVLAFILLAVVASV